MINLSNISEAQSQLTSEEYVRFHSDLSQEQITNKLNSGMSYDDIAIEHDSAGRFKSKADYDRSNETWNHIIGD